MYFYGEIQHALLADAVVFLGREQACGVLTCQNGPFFKQVTFSDGCVVSVLSNMPEERLGSSLVRRGLLSEAEVRRALQEQARMDMKLGEVLISLGVLDRISLAEELVRQAGAALSNLFGWAEGQFVFQSKEVRVPADHLVWLEMGPLVFRDLLELGCPMLERIDAGGTITLNRPLRNPSFAIGSEAKPVLRALRSGASLEQLATLVPLPTDRLKRLLFALDVIGLVDLPLRSSPLPTLGELVAFHRSVLRSILLQADAERGAAAAATVRESWIAGLRGTAAPLGTAEEWAAAPPAAAELAPPVELDTEGFLQLLHPEDWSSRHDPGLLRSLAQHLEAATMRALLALKERYGSPLVDKLVDNLRLTGQLVLRRNRTFREFVAANWEQLLGLSATIPTSFEQGMERFEAGDERAAASLLELVGPEHAERDRARQVLARIREPDLAPSAPAAAGTARPELAPEPAAPPAAAAQPDAGGSERPAAGRREPTAALDPGVGVDAALDIAQKALEDGEVSAVLARCLLILAEQPENARAKELFLQASLQADSGFVRTEADQLWAEASAELAAALQDSAEGDALPLWADEPAEARIRWQEGDEDDEPAAGPAPAAQSAPEDEALLLREARAKMQARDFETALGLFRLLLAMHPQDPDALRGEASAREALRLQRPVLEALEQSRACEERGEFANAVAHLERAVALDPSQDAPRKHLKELQDRLVQYVHATFGPHCKPRPRLARHLIEQVNVGLDEGFLLSQIDGQTDLRSLALIGGLGTATTYRLVLSLLARGLVEMPSLQPPPAAHA